MASRTVATSPLHPEPRRAVRVAAWLCAAALSGGLGACSGEGTVVVQVRTDLVPGADFAAVDVVVMGDDGAPDRRFERAARDDRAWGAGVRAAEASLAEGTYRARVAAVDVSGAAVVDRPVSFEVRGGELRVVTVVLTRDCAGVECPLSGADASQVACLAGRCVEEGCTEETPERCGARECASADECAEPVASCAARECTASGACVELPDHGACDDASQVCSTAAGCVPASGGPLSAPGPGHVVLDALGPAHHVHRLELRDGAVAQDVSSLLDPAFPPDGSQEDSSAALSSNGEWLSLVTRRGGCDFCPLVAPVRDPAAGALIAEVPAAQYRGTAVTDDGRGMVFVDPDEQIRLLTRGLDGWTLRPEPLSGDSPHTFHGSPSLSPAGARLVFLCGPGPDSVGAGICEVGMDGEGFRELLPPRTGIRVDSPRITPDGELIYEAGPSEGETDLWRLPPEGTPVLAFPDVPEVGQQPCVLPDGRLATFYPNRVLVVGTDGRTTISFDPGLPPERYGFYVDGCGR